MLSLCTTTLIVRGSPSERTSRAARSFAACAGTPGDTVGRTLLVGLETDLYAIEANGLEPGGPCGVSPMPLVIRFA